MGLLALQPATDVELPEDSAAQPEDTRVQFHTVMTDMLRGPLRPSQPEQKAIRAQRPLAETFSINYGWAPFLAWCCVLACDWSIWSVYTLKMDLACCTSKK